MASPLWERPHGHRFARALTNAVYLYLQGGPKSQDAELISFILTLALKVLFYFVNIVSIIINGFFCVQITLSRIN